MANMASSRRVETPVLSKMFDRWRFTVSSLSPNCLAMSRLEQPSTMQPTTSISRGVRPKVLRSGTAACFFGAGAGLCRIGVGVRGGRWAGPGVGSTWVPGIAGEMEGGGGAEWDFVEGELELVVWLAVEGDGGHVGARYLLR